MYCIRVCIRRRCILYLLVFGDVWFSCASVVSCRSRCKDFRTLDIVSMPRSRHRRGSSTAAKNVLYTFIIIYY